MALIKDVKELEKYIPEINGNNISIGNYGYITDENVLSKPIFALVYDEEKKKFVDMYRAEFVVYKSPDTHYIIVSRFDVPISSNTLSAGVPTKEFLTRKTNKYGFNKDEEGIFIKVTHPRNYSVYFCTKITDAKEIRDAKKTKETVTTEAIYI